MKTMSINLKYFSGLALIFSVTFFHYLYVALSIQSYSNVRGYAILFGITLFISGLTLGYKDAVRNSRHDLGFQYHLMTFIIVNSVGVIALLLEMGISVKNVATGVLSIVLWGIGLLVHFYFSSKSIKGFDKKEIFD